MVFRFHQQSQAHHAEFSSAKRGPSKKLQTMKHLFFTISLLATTAITWHELAASSVSDFIDFTLRSARSNTVVLPGRLYVPPEAGQPGSPRPLMIFLAGSGANGTDNLAQLAQVTDVMMAEAKDRGAFLYVPQTASTWSSQSVTDEVMTMVDRAIGTLNADRNRVYLTGYSLGSYGTWTMLSRYDGRFAAAIPLSGGTAASDFVPARLIDTPILSLHARDDPTASVTATRNILNSILAAAHEPLPTFLAGSDPRIFFMSNGSVPSHAELRELIDQEPANVNDFLLSNSKLDLMYYEPQLGGHNTLGAFNAPELYNWMFTHSLAVPEPSASLLLLTPCLAIAMFSSRQWRSNM
jgi:predicted peptidase